MIVKFESSSLIDETKLYKQVTFRQVLITANEGLIIPLSYNICVATTEDKAKGKKKTSSRST